MKKYQIFLLIGLFAVAVTSCDEAPSEKRKTSKTAIPKSFEFSSPTSNQKFKTGDDVVIGISSLDANVKIDSAQIYLDKNKFNSIYSEEEELTWSTVNAGVGKHNLTAELFFDGKTERISMPIVLFSDVEPIEYSYEVVNKFQHDPKAFTQGLVFDRGELYEGTGMKGQSQLRRVELESGKVLNQKKLNPNYFGEGVTIFNNKLYQLTWKAGLAIIYDKQTFEELSQFYYKGEGWGITHDSISLIISNGSNVLQFINPDDFSVERKIEVYDENGAVGYLNELEWINGKIYSNVWQRDIIVIIDPETGKVEGRINLNNLLPSSIAKPGVLNGIAYDKESDRLFVTGKYWPLLFEIAQKS